MTKADLKVEKVIELIKQHRGNLSKVSAALGCARQTLYGYIADKPTVQAAITDARESMIDGVESRLYSKALAGEAWAVTFFLKTQGYKRGYGEHLSLTGADGGAIEVAAKVVVYIPDNGRNDNQAPTGAANGIPGNSG